MSGFDIGVYWQNFLDWFVGLPLFGQVLVIAGACTILILAIVLVYYIIKGVAYLIYYILKGVYYLLKGIAIGLYKLCEAIYYSISGKEKPKKQEEVVEVEETPVITEKTPEPEIYNEPPVISFCSECGLKFTENMINQLEMKGHVYCIHCGNGISTPMELTS